MCRSDPIVRLCLACGNIQNRAGEPLARHFKENDKELLDEDWL
jgi:hypothetical protein